MEIIFWDKDEKTIIFKKGNKLYKAKVISQQGSKLHLYIVNTNQTEIIDLAPTDDPETNSEQELTNVILAPLSGRIVTIFVQEEEAVSANQPLLTIESMKMENEIRAPFDLFVQTIPIAPGDLVQQEQLLMTIKPQNKKDDV